ncbi:hypothetical protein B0G85_1866 [Polynucleobacter brandtiae]|uniref:Uncharacterized protein n=2 Tax=Polynucleobacter brandtiae TaxID=1938816 RepID=A0A2M8VJ52_9BURK|nr:hypothetical protein [Polynucleobacter brandtiae]PJI76947.1 hypothetical protein B0G85_1866 [Polynucleobacter brandtiae]
MKYTYIMLMMIPLANAVAEERLSAHSVEFEKISQECHFQFQQSQQSEGAQQANSSAKVDTIFDACMSARGWSSPKGNPSQAMLDDIQELIKASIVKMKASQEATCVDPTLKLYYERSSCLGDQITFEQLTDSSKITPAQKEVLIKQRAAVAVHQKEGIEFSRQVGGVMGGNIADLMETLLTPQNDQNNLDLYSGKITWGEYNQVRKSIATKFRETIKNLEQVDPIKPSPF